MNKIIAIYKEDKSVIFIHPAIKSKKLKETETAFLTRVYERHIVNNPDHKDLDYEIIDKTNIPDRKFRDCFEGEKGKAIKINTTKKNNYLKEKAIKNKMNEIVREQAIEALKQEGVI